MIHFIQHWLGFQSGQGNDSPYLFWSGFFGDLAIFAAAMAIVLRHNCHKKGCWRFGWKEWVDPDGHTHLLCKKHHPHNPPTAEYLAAAAEQEAQINMVDKMAKND